MRGLRQASVALFGVGAGVALIGAACSPSGAIAGNQTTGTPAPRASTSTSTRGSAMALTPCQNDNLHRSKCMIELILADVERAYGGIDGGGISQIDAKSSTSMSVSLPFEGRVETLTYEFEVKNGSVAIKGKTSATKSYG